MNIKRCPIFKLTTSIIALAFSALIVYQVVYSGFAMAAKPGHTPVTVRLITHEVSLGKSQPGEVKYSRVISGDNRHIAYTVKTNDGEFVMVDGCRQNLHIDPPSCPH